MSRKTKVGYNKHKNLRKPHRYIHNAASEEIEMADLTAATLAETRDSVNSKVKTVDSFMN